MCVAKCSSKLVVDGFSVVDRVMLFIKCSLVVDVISMLVTIVLDALIVEYTLSCEKQNLQI